MQSKCRYGRNPIAQVARIIEKLPVEARTDFEFLLHSSTYPANTVIFAEKEPATGLYVVLAGEIHVSINSADGRRLSLRIAHEGELLGLSSVFSGSLYNATAETFYPSRVAYISRQEFMAFLSRHPCAYRMIIEEMSRKLSTACEQLRTVALSNSAPEKLARLLLDWCENGQETQQGCRMRFALTHEQIGEFIGASRETVTRTLTNFKRTRLIKFEGTTLTIPNRAALESFTHG